MFSGSWENQKQAKLSDVSGNEAMLKFEGVAIAVLGVLNQKGGRADVYIDGKKQKQGLDAFIVERTHDNVLWQIYDLKPGEHILRISTVYKADPRSKGREVAVTEAVVYRAK